SGSSGIGPKIVRLSQRPADALSRLRLIREPQQHMHVRVWAAASSGVAIPAYAEPVRPMPLVEQRSSLAKKLERRLDFRRREIEDCWTVCLRNDHPTSAEKVTI